MSDAMITITESDLQDRLRKAREESHDEAADLLQGEYDDEDASIYLFEMNPHREPGKTYCPIHGVGDHTFEGC